jgi:outer membrane protein W
MKANPTIQRFFLCLVLVVTSLAVQAQVFLEKQTRHRFAQLNVGLDVQGDWGGSTFFTPEAGALEGLDLPFAARPRFIIGGTHFWGHADFYIAIAVLRSELEAQSQTFNLHPRVETGFRYYPWRIQQGKLRPFVGIALGSYQFDQNGTGSSTQGATRYHIGLPALAGFTFNHRAHLFEIGFSWNYLHKIDYFTSPLEQVEVATHPFRLAVGYKYMIETTLSAEQDWESGRTQEVTEKLAAKGRLNNFFIGAGVSSVWWLEQAAYNQEQRPYFPNPGIQTMADFTVGYYWHRPDLNVAVNYRGYQNVNQAFDIEQTARRRSVGLEVTKFLFDYHGFVPFVGPVVSYEQLSFQESLSGVPGLSEESDQLGYGITFGWDIRPNRIQSFILRTNLRYWPNLPLQVTPENNYNFSNIEFNFIQLIVYPGRMF